MSSDATALPFAGHTVMITGAAGDIGRTTAVRLAKHGAKVVLADIAAGLDATAEQCLAANPDCAPVSVSFDVTDDAAVETMFAELTASGTLCDLLFNNAGYQGEFTNVLNYGVEDFRRVLDINVTGVFIVLKHFANTLTAAGRGGAVVNTASMAHTGAPNMAAYSASKAAVKALTNTAARDLADRSIRVNSISPAFIGPGMMWDRQVALQAETPSQYYGDDPAEVERQMIGAVPLRRYGSLDEVAAAVQFLLSDESGYITAFDIEISGGL